MFTYFTNIKRIIVYLFATVFFVGASGCDTTQDEDRCEIFGICDVENELNLTLIEHTNRLPANVSILFKVDTDDDYPIANLRPSDFQIYENENLISIFESQQSILPKTGTFKYSIALLLDLSGSIVNSENLESLKQAAESFVGEIIFPEDDPRFGEIEMGIWWFDGQESITSLVSYTIDPEVLTDGIASITADLPLDNSTNLYGAVIQGADIARERLITISSADIISAGSVVLFTDGTDQANRETRSDALRAVHNAMGQISVYTIGLGGEIDEPTLTEIGVNGFVSAPNIDQLLPKFQELADLVRAQANSYYLLEYCSPKRDGENDLTIKATSGVYVGILSTNFSAENFTPGCTVSSTPDFSNAF